MLYFGWYNLTNLDLLREDTKMPELPNIPLTYKEGVYSAADFCEDIDDSNAISFDYDAQYQMLTYDIPVGKCKHEMTLYSENIEGDNERIITMVRCAEGHSSENFRYAMDIMSKYIEEHALATLHNCYKFSLSSDAKLENHIDLCYDKSGLKRSRTQRLFVYGSFIFAFRRKQ